MPTIFIKLVFVWRNLVLITLSLAFKRFRFSSSSIVIYSVFVCVCILWIWEWCPKRVISPTNTTSNQRRQQKTFLIKKRKYRRRISELSWVSGIIIEIKSYHAENITISEFIRTVSLRQTKIWINLYHRMQRKRARLKEVRIYQAFTRFYVAANQLCII